MNEPPPAPWKPRPAVRILCAPWKRWAIDLTPRLFRVAVIAYLVIGIPIVVGWWRHDDGSGRMIWIILLTLINLPVAFMTTLVSDDGRMATQAQRTLGGRAFATGKAWRAPEGGVWTSGYLLLGEDRLIFTPRFGRSRQTEVLLQHLATATLPPGTDLLVLTLADGTTERFRTDCPKLWLEELEKARAGGRFPSAEGAAGR